MVSLPWHSGYSAALPLGGMPTIHHGCSLALFSCHPPMKPIRHFQPPAMDTSATSRLQ